MHTMGSRRSSSAGFRSLLLPLLLAVVSLCIHLSRAPVLADNALAHEGESSSAVSINSGQLSSVSKKGGGGGGGRGGGGGFRGGGGGGGFPFGRHRHSVGAELNCGGSLVGLALILAAAVLI